MLASLFLNPRFTFKSDGLSLLESLHVLKFEGEEEISRLFRFEITLISESPDIDLEKVLTGAASLTIRSLTGLNKAIYHGILSEFEQMDRTGGYFTYRAVLVPRLWKLTLDQMNEVYVEDVSVPTLVQKVLKAGGLSSLDYSVVLKNPFGYRERTLITQYQESSFNFINRLMEREGIYFYFDHVGNSGGGDKLRITDFNESLPLLNIRLAIYVPPENVSPVNQDDAIIRFSSSRRRLPEKVLVQDYNYRKASLTNGLTGEAQVTSSQGQGTVMYFGENIRNDSEASKMAKVRAEALSCQNEVFSGEALAVGIRSGYRLGFAGHYRLSNNGTYLVTRVRHIGSQEGVIDGTRVVEDELEKIVAGSYYRAKFEAISSSLQYRPELRTPKPVIAGTLPAIVDGSGFGDQPEINEYGQYKVILMYDSSSKGASKASSWVRMATPYAGSKNGMNFPLLKGTEVIIGFMGGDPDQPAILGAITNSENPNVVTSNNSHLNGFKTTSGNQMIISDDPLQSYIQLSSPKSGCTITMGVVPIPSQPPVLPVSDVDMNDLLKLIENG